MNKTFALMTHAAKVGKAALIKNAQINVYLWDVQEIVRGGNVRILLIDIIDIVCSYFNKLF